MRLISRKIWRAFPELDRYSDEVCENYIRHARRFSNQATGAVLMAVTFIIGILLWAFLVFNTHAIVYYLNDWHSYHYGFLQTLTADVITFTGYIWFPILLTLFARDRWLIRSIRKQLRSSVCAGCGYQLRGLEIHSTEHGKHVICPECGTPTQLNTGHISEADIDPKILRSS